MRCEAQHRAVAGFEGNTVLANRNGSVLGTALQLVSASWCGAQLLDLFLKAPR